MANNLADKFEAMADAVPERVAVVDRHRRVTYSELETEANRLAHDLAAHGVVAGDRVGLVARNSVPFAVALLASFKLRAVPVNINYRYVPAELAEIFLDSGVTALVVDLDLADACAAAVGNADEPHYIVTIGRTYEEAVATGSPARDFGPRSGDDINILYTGGTTGRPKGVVWRQEDTYLLCTNGMGNDSAIAEAMAHPSATFVMLPAGPFIHSSSQWNLLGALLSGRTIVALDRFDAAAVWDLCDREGVSFLAVTGDAMVRPLLNALGPERPPPASVRIISSSGGMLSPTMKEALVRTFPAAVVFDAIGSTETGLLGTAPAASASISNEFRVTAGPGTIVVDADGRPVTPGQLGLLAKSGGIPLRYHNDDEKTSRTFITYEGTRYAIPGDAARLEADGSITVLGRQSSCINTGGEKVYPNEVEGVLMAHADVEDCLVIGRPDERWGQLVAAIVATRPGREVSLAALQEHARPCLAAYKVPRALCLVREIERQPSGKPDYRWANEVAASGQWRAE